MATKMPVELNRSGHNGKLLSVKLYPVKTAGGNIDQWYSITVLFRYVDLINDEPRPNQVSLSGQTVTAEVAFLMADAVKLAAEIATAGAVDFDKCAEVTDEQNNAYWAERRAEKKALDAERAARREGK